MKDRTTIVLLIALIGLVVLGVLFGKNPHPKFAWHSWPGFQAIVGVASAVVVSIVAKAIAYRILYRPEDEE